MTILALTDGVVDLARRALERGDDRVGLTTKEAELLAYLAARPGEVVPRAELATEVWGYHPDTETRAIDTAVKRLRAKIEVDPKAPDHVLTVHGVGYTFAPLAPRPDARPMTVRPPPATLDAFIGRDEELAAVTRLFAEGARLVTLVGPGGQGKSRLARELAARGGAFAYVPLTDRETAADIVAAVADALRVPLSDARSPADAASQIGRALDGLPGLVVILDDAERVVGPLAETLTRWLEVPATASSRRFLVTSRERLRLAGEHVVPLGPLDADAGAQLFWERAAGLGAATPRDPASDAAARALSERLDGLPLALELAAARAGVLSPAAILDRLGDPEDTLSGGSSGGDVLAATHRDGGARHGTLRATIAWSWELLGPTERAALARCAVFRGGFDLDAAEAVLTPAVPDGDVVGVLATLRDKSLVTVDPRDDGRWRFGLLFAIARFCGERLAAEPDALAEAEGAHHAYYLAAAEAAAAEVDGPRPEPALAWLGAERDNLRAVAARASEPGVRARAALALAPSLAMTGPLDGHVALLDRAVADARAAGDAALVLRARLDRAAAREVAARLDEAEVDLAAVVALVSDDGASTDTWSRARALAIEARVARARNHPEAALAALDRWRLAPGAALDDAPRAAAMVAHERGLTRLHLGELAAAEEAFEAARRALRRLGRRRDEAVVIGHLARAQHEAGALDAAHDNYARALTRHRAMGDRRHAAEVLLNLAVLEHERERLDASARLWAEALAEHRAMGNRRAEGFALGGLGALAHERGELAEARRWIEASLAIMEELGDVRFEGIALARLGAMQAALGDAERGARTLRRARALMADEDGGRHLRALTVFEGFCDVARARAEPDRAGAHLAAARARLSPDPGPRFSLERVAARILARAIAET